MKKIPSLNLFLQTCLLLAGSALALAGEAVADYPWQASAGRTVAEVDGRSCARIEHSAGAAERINLLTITNPAITARFYALKGEVKYEGIEGESYLEMWSYFSTGRVDRKENGFFSRTLAEKGPMGKLSGSSGWRPFVLPFDRSATSNAPTRLEINLILPGRGSVWMGPLRLEQFSKARTIEDALSSSGWWAPSKTGLIGGIGGGCVGCLGGLIGWLISKGKARGFVVASSIALIVLGAVFLVGGIAALAFRQPYHVWYPLLLPGVLLLAIIPFNLRQALRRYAALELRRMDAMEA